MVFIMKKITYIFAAIFIFIVEQTMALDIKFSGKKVGMDKQGNTIYQTKANGIEIGYKLIGSGTPLVLLIGLGRTMENWPEKFIKDLSKKHLLILLDNRGLGYTTANDTKFDYKLFADDVIGLLDALKIQKTNILGYSMGSIITQELLMEYPQRFNKAIICASSVNGKEVAKVLKGHISEDPITQRQYEAITQWKTPLNKLSLIPNQTMIIIGTSDEVVKVDSSKILATTIPGAWLVQFKNGSHNLAGLPPSELAKIILTFLDINETIEVEKDK